MPREKRHLRAQRAQHAGQFHRDVAAADDGDSGGPLLELEKAVGGDAQFGPGDVGHRRIAAGGDDDVAAFQYFARRHPRCGAR